MTREEAIKILEGLAVPVGAESAFDMAIEALQQSAWIPVGDEPPKQKKTYWICTDGGYQRECRWTNNNPIFTNLTTDWHWCIFDVPQHSKVVAWMPLPEPYREKEGDSE